MRAVPIAVLLLGFCSVAYAGVYTSDGVLESPNFPRTEAIPARIFELRAIAKAAEPITTLRKTYLEKANYYQALLQDKQLTNLDAINYSAVLMRLGDPRLAQQVLRRHGDQSHFLVQANLSAAYQQEGNYQQALEHQRLALKFWPPVWAGWSRVQLASYRECERYNEKLLIARERERYDPRAMTNLPPLFPGVKFVGPDGRYVAGGLDVSMADKLPTNAGNIVLQLALWQPADRQLCWLLAELLNATGNVEAASRLMTSMVEGDNLEVRELREHYRDLDRAAAFLKQFKTRPNVYILASTQLMTPRATLGPPVAGDVAYYYAALAAVEAVPKWEDQQEEARLMGPRTEPGEPLSPGVPPMPFNTGHVVVSFIFGVAVAALLGMQWQQWRRRRQQTIASMHHPENVPQQPEPLARTPDSRVQQAPPS